MFNLSDAFGTARFGQQAIQQGNDLASALATGFVRKMIQEEEEEKRAKAANDALLGSVASLGGAAIGSQIPGVDSTLGAAIGAEAGKALIGKADTSNILNVALKQQEIASDEKTNMVTLTGKALLAREKAGQDELKDIQDQENVLRKEFNTSYTQFKEVLDAKDKVREALEENNAAGDLAGIFAFMKTVDPGSVVREGEFRNAEQSMGMLQRLGILPNKILAGERLSPNQRKAFIAMANKQFNSQAKNFKTEYGRYKNIIDNQGLHPVNVFGSDNMDDLIKMAPMIEAETGDTGNREQIKTETGSVDLSKITDKRVSALEDILSTSTNPAEVARAQRLLEQMKKLAVNPINSRDAEIPDSQTRSSNRLIGGGRYDGL